MLSTSTNSENKMTLLSEVFAASDAGEYEIAKQKLEILAKESPGDPLVEAALKDVNDRILRGDTPPSRISLSIKAQNETEIQRKAVVRANRALIESELLIVSGNYDGALGVLYSAERGISNNAQTQKIMAKINAKKADALFSQTNRSLRDGNQLGALESLASLAALEGNTKRFRDLRTAYVRGEPLPKDPVVIKPRRSVKREIPPSFDLNFVLQFIRDNQSTTESARIWRELVDSLAYNGKCNLAIVKSLNEEDQDRFFNILDGYATGELPLDTIRKMYSELLIPPQPNRRISTEPAHTGLPQSNLSH